MQACTVKINCRSRVVKLYKLLGWEMSIKKLKNKINVKIEHYY